MTTREVLVFTYPQDERYGRAGRVGPRPPLVIAYLTEIGLGHNARAEACIHHVEARDGARAKLAAIKEHRHRCLQKGGAMEKDPNEKPADEKPADEKPEAP